MKPMAAAAGAALIAGVAMYTVGARTAEVNAFANAPAPVYSQDGQVQYVPAYGSTFQPAAAPVAASVREAAAPHPVARPQRTVYRTTAPVEERAIVQEGVQTQPKRSWKKTAMIIGGSAASGAAIGGIVDGKKGALIGAAIGGGAASIYEATRRR